MLRDPRFERIDVFPITGALGADIRGVDLSASPDDATFAEVRKALHIYHVIAVRDQKLTPPAYKLVAARFGEFSPNPVHASMDDLEHIIKFVREPDDTGKVIGEDWHMDLAWLPRPPGITMLYGEVVPPVGGDTCFTSLASDLSEFPVTFARAYGGDFISPDLKLLPDAGAMEKALTTLQDIFKAGALPRSYATTKNDDQVTWMQQGRAAFTVITFARGAQMNKPGESKYPGKIKAVEFPGSEALIKSNVPMAAVSAVWGMSILANAKDKDLAWAYIREVSSKAVTTGAARNGNGPVRASTYADPSFSKDQPFAAVEAKALVHARVPLPAFPEAARAQTVFLEEVQLCVIGQKTPKATVDAIRERCTPLVKA